MEPCQELPLRELFSEMEKAWREGDEADKREELDERRDACYLSVEKVLLLQAVQKPR